MTIKPPALELRRGFIKVCVWRKRTRSGLRIRLSVTWLFRNGYVRQESGRFGRDDLPLVAKVNDLAHT